MGIIRKKKLPTRTARKIVTNNVELEITNSSRTTFLNCQEKYNLTYNELLTPKDGKTFFTVGDIFHDAQAGILKRRPINHVLQKVRKSIKESRKHFIGNLVKFEKDCSIIEGMIHGYYQNRGILKNAKVPIINGRPAVEMAFRIRLANNVVLRGKIDALVKLPDGYWLVEHKSTGRLDSNFIDKLPINSQITTYLFAMNHVLPKQIASQVKGVIYNVVGKVQIRQKKKESLVSFNNRLYKEYTSPQKRPQLFFQRRMYRNAKQLQRFERDLMTTAENIRRCNRTKIYQQNEYFCTYYGKCEFLPICTKGRTAPIMAMYRERETQHHEIDED